MRQRRLPDFDLTYSFDETDILKMYETVYYDLADLTYYWYLFKLNTLGAERLYELSQRLGS